MQDRGPRQVVCKPLLCTEGHGSFSLALAHCYAAMLHQFRREPLRVQQQAEAAMTLCTEQGFTYYSAWAMILQGWALTIQSADRANGEAMEQLHQGFADLLATGQDLESVLSGPCCGGRWVRREERPRATAIGRGFRCCRAYTGTLLGKQNSTDCKGRCSARMLQRSPREGVEANLFRALEVARSQQSKSLELHAAMSLGRMWQKQGKRDAARSLLVPVYNWFTEGFDTRTCRRPKRYATR